MSELKAKTIRGLQWATLSQIVRQVWQVALSAIMARLLCPADYGLFGMALVFVGFAGIFSTLGFSAVLVQRKDLSARHIDAAFALQLSLGLVLTLLVLGTAPLIAQFFHEPQLTTLVRALAFLFALTPFQSVPGQLLAREMQFRSIAIRDITAGIVSGLIALAMALTGCGVWSLVAQALSNALLSALLVWRLIPRAPRPVFDRAALREMWGFSGNYLGSTVVNYWARNVDSMLIGKMLGKLDVGIYSRAYSLMLLPLSQVTGVVAQVMFPALSQIQDDHAKVRRVYLKAMRMLAFFTFPMMAGLMVTADPFIRVLCGPQWLAAIPIFKILCVVGLLQSIGATGGWIFTSQGRTDLMFRWTIAYTLVSIVCFAAGLQWGLLGLATAYAGLNILIWYPEWKLVGGIIKLSVWEITANLLPVFFVTVLMAVLLMACDSVWFVQWAAIWRLLVLTVIGAGLYLGGVILVRAEALHDWLELLPQTAPLRWYANWVRPSRRGKS
jgi:O-antigen/teichoic acid export membrane protein